MCRYDLHPIISVQTSILNGFRDMAGLNLFAVIQIRNGARHFQRLAVVARDDIVKTSFGAYTRS